jgi:hypothetical protein
MDGGVFLSSDGPFALAANLRPGGFVENGPRQPAEIEREIVQMAQIVTSGVLVRVKRKEVSRRLASIPAAAQFAERIVFREDLHIRKVRQFSSTVRFHRGFCWLGYGYQRRFGDCQSRFANADVIGAIHWKQKNESQ